MALSLAMNEESSPARPPRITSGHILNNLQDITFQLTARCAGLLEVKDGSKERHRQYTFFGVSPKAIKWLHRTARDYIEHPLRWNKLVAMTAGTQFNPATSLLRICVDLLHFDRMEIDLKIQGNDSRRRFDDHVGFLSYEALIYAFHSDYQTRNPQCTLLDQLSILRARDGNCPYLRHNLQWEARNSRTTLRKTSTNVDIHDFLVLAVKYGLVAYVREKLRHQSSGHPIEASYASMLQYIPRIATNSGRVINSPPPISEMVELSLQHGADPNAHYNGQSA